MVELNATMISGLAVSDQKASASDSHRETIPDGKPWFTDEEIEFVLAEVPGVLRGQLSNGPWTARFEQTVAAAAGTRYAVAFPSCTASLEAVLMALRIGPGDEVLVPTQTFIATGMAVHLVGARPVFCDIAAETHCLDPKEIVRKAGPRTKAVILVHMGGLITPHIREILRHCEARGLPLIEDCAHAHGAHWQGKPAGSLGVAGCFSYYPTKIITSGEGGALTTNDEALAATARSLQNRGRDMAAPAELYTLSGRNNRFPEISALLGVAQYRRLEELLQARNELAAYYRRRLLAEAPRVTIQAQPEAGRHSYWKFIANLPSGYSRQRMQAHLRDRNVPLSWSYYPPLHSQPVFAALFDPAEADCPVADELLERNVCLPIHPRITLAQRELVIDAFVEALRLEESRQ